MIRPINIKLNAAHPELPLVEATTFTGAPSSVFIRGVPKSVGNWSITTVNVSVTYPDNSTTTRAAVESAEGVWVATIPGTATSGRTAAGFKIMADGIDENGAAVTGYVLGFADFSVLSFTPVPAPGGTFYLLRYFDQAPATPKEGDAAKIDGVLKFYNGTAWEPFAAPITLDDAVTRTSANGVKSSGIWSAIWGTASTAFSSLYDWCVVQLAGKVPTSRTVNGKPLSDNVALTGADIAVSAADATKMDAALAGKLDKSGGTMTGPIIGIRTNGDANREVSLAKINLVEAGVARKGSGKLGICIDLTDGTDREASLFIDDDGKVYINTPSGYVEVPNAINGGTLALTAGTGHAGNLAALDSQGNPTDSTIPAANVAVKGEIPYSLGTPIVIDTASSEVVEGETVYYGTATLANRTANIVQVTAATALDELRITFPTATNGKVRDFGLRVEIGTGSAALSAPSLVPIAPTGETIKIENNAAEIPALADGTATAKGVTLLYFSETAPGVFVVKGEQVEEVA